MSIYAPTADIAHCYHEAGLAVIPLRLDGTKAPSVKWAAEGWRRSSWEELAPWFDRPAPCGIGVICGRRSGNLEVLDFDCHRSPSVYPRWANSIASELIAKLVIVATPSGGRHAWYRSMTTEGGTALARAAETEEGKLPPATIELKAEGCYIVAPGSPAETHPDHDLYDLIQGDPRHPPLLSNEERAELHRHARALNLYHPDTKPPTKPINRKRLGGRKLPGDIFNQTAEWEDILEPHGWRMASTKGGTTYWTKPDGTRGHTHATTGYGGANLFHCFTSDASPFTEGEDYKPFAVFALLNHDGDFKRAAAALKTRHL